MGLKEGEREEGGDGCRGRANCGIPFLSYLSATAPDRHPPLCMKESGGEIFL